MTSNRLGATLGLLLLLNTSCGRAEGHHPEPAAALPASSVRYELAWSTFAGGDRFDQMREVFVEDDGAVLAAGIVMSSGLPTSKDAVQPEYAGDDPRTGHPGGVGGDAYFLRLDAKGERMLAATYLGGSKQERGAYGVDITSDGDVVAVLATRSRDMPTTKEALQKRYGGGTADACAARLSRGLDRLRWCTYLGTREEDWPRGGLALGRDDSVYLFGICGAKTFPVTGKAKTGLRGSHARGAMIAGISPDGRSQVLGAVIGGRGSDHILGGRVAADGDLLVAGHTRSPDFPTTAAAQPEFGGGEFEAWVARLAADGSGIEWCTFLGGKGDDYVEHRPLLLEDGSFIVCGSTGSRDFPTTPGVCRTRFKGRRSDGFVTKYSADGKVLWSTLVGGGDADNLLAPIVDADGNVHVVAQTSSRDWPVTEGAIQTEYGGGPADGALVVLSPDAGKILYGTYLGGAGDDIARATAFAADGALLIAGGTRSRDFPTTTGAYQTRHAGESDGFILRLSRRR